MNNCTDTQSQMLENLHLEVIRIIVGSIRGTSHKKLYEESGFCTLKERRKRHKLCMFRKMILGPCPQYVSAWPLAPFSRSHKSAPQTQTVRKRRYYTLLHAQLTFFKTPLFHLLQTKWNPLPISVKQGTSLSVFKRSLSLSDGKVPAYNCFGERSEQISHCRIRLEMGNLNNNLFNCHLSTDPNVLMVILKKWPSIASSAVVIILTSVPEQYLVSLAIFEHCCAVS